MSKQTNQIYEFGAFRIDADEGLLRRDGEVVPLAPKVFDMLLVLVESGGHLIAKEELMARVWPDSFVEEANISRNIFTLRKVLGDEYIETVPKRGYRFVAPVNLTVPEDGEGLVLEERSRSRIIVLEQQDSQEDNEPRPALGPGTAVPVTQSPPRSRVSPRRLAAAIILIAIAAVAYYFKARQQPASAPIRSIAVLPFRPLSAESRDESLELGMADALITKLSNVKQVVVRPTSSVLKYARSDKDLLAAGREQGVDAVIEGKLQRVGNRIRMTVQLLKVSDGTSLWTGTFDDNFTNVFTLQDSVSAQVAESLATRLTGEEQKRIAKHYTDNIEAYQLYLKGRLQWYKFSPDGVARSIDYFNQAIALDQSYALAYAGLSFAYSVQGAIGEFPPAQILPKSRTAAETALRLDDTLAEAHVAIGGKHLFYEREWSNAKTEFDRAVELNPNQADAHELLGYYWQVVGQYDKAERELKNAQNIAPLMALTGMDIAQLAYYEHNYDQAIDLYGKAHDVDPDVAPVPFFLGQAYERKGQYEKAITECRKVLASSPDNPSILSVLGYADARAGRTPEAQAILQKFQETRKQRYVSPLMIALLCAGLDRTDEAFQWLNTACEERDPQLIFVHLDPEFDGLHGDPRFIDLLRRMNVKP